MADMDTIVIRNRPDEYISATLGPEGHKVSHIALMRIIAKAIKDIKAGNGEEINLDY